ncbi:MAG TPA: hypothetical protein PK720_04070 [bacterium]|nr:hypothetical protein [bacterium]
MNINYKKVGLISLFFLVTVFAAYLLYTFFFKTPTPQTPGAQTETPSITGNGLPQSNIGNNSTEIPTGGQLPGQDSENPSNPTSPSNSTGTPNSLDNIIADQANFSSINQNGQIQFYNQVDNRFYTVDNQGKLVTLSNKQFFGVKQVTWSPNASRAILEYPDGNKIRYDFQTQSQVTLPKHWEDFAFSPAGEQIVAKSIGLDPDNRWLVVANDDGSKAKNIEPLGENADKVISSWSPNNQSIAFFIDGVDFNRKEVFFIGQNGENFKSTITEGRGFKPLWSPKGDELLYSVYSADNDYKPSLWVVGAQGDSIGANRRPLSLDTWADKCSFSQSSLYCAVPVSLERGAGMFPKSAQSTQDLLYRINTLTGQKEIIPVSTSATINNLSFSPDGNYLYYIEGGTNRLRKVKIK